MWIKSDELLRATERERERDDCGTVPELPGQSAIGATGMSESTRPACGGGEMDNQHVELCQQTAIDESFHRSKRIACKSDDSVR